MCLAPRRAAQIASCTVYMLFGTCNTALMLWRLHIEAEQDTSADLSHHLKWYLRGSLGLRICWLIIMTWLLFALAMTVIMTSWVWITFAAVGTSLGYQVTYGELFAELPNCPITCLDLTAIIFIQVGGGAKGRGGEKEGGQGG